MAYIAERNYVVVQEAAQPTAQEGWREVALGGLVRNFDSRRIPLSSRERAARPGTYPYYGATGVMDYVNDYLFEGLHLLVAEDGSVETPDGKPFLQLVDGQFWVNNHAHVLQGSTDEETRYLYYALSTVPIRPFMSGSVQAKLSQGNLNQIPVPYPCEESQRRAVAHVLGTLDYKIELNRRMSETLEEMARALFKSWFVEFDPVRAKMDGRWRRGESLPGLPADLYDLFPDRLVDSELGEIPEGWEVGTMSQLAKRIQSGGTPKRLEPTYWDAGDIPWLTSGEVRQSFVLDTQNYISRLGLAHSSANVIPARSILVALYGATAGQVSMNIRPLTTNQAVTAIIPCDGNRYFCLVSLKSQVGELGSRAVGSAQQNISKKEVESTTVVLPPIELRLNFDTMVEALFERIFRNLAESRAISMQRDELLPRLVSGEVKV